MNIIFIWFRVRNVLFCWMVLSFDTFSIVQIGFEEWSLYGGKEEYFLALSVVSWNLKVKCWIRFKCFIYLYLIVLIEEDKRFNHLVWGWGSCFLNSLRVLINIWCCLTFFSVEIEVECVRFIKIPKTLDFEMVYWKLLADGRILHFVHKG